MRLLSKLCALQRRSEISQRQCEAQLAQLAREDGELRHSKDALNTQKEGLSQLLKTLTVTGSVLARDQLYVLLRKQAVLRYQLQNLGLQSAQLDEQRQLVARHVVQRQDERRVWLHKGDKYQRWVTRIREQNQRLNLRQDEAELEERQPWNP